MGLAGFDKKGACPKIPVQIIHEGGAPKAVQFQKCLEVLNQKGQFSPVFDHEQTIAPKADVVLVAVGQSIAWGGLLTGSTAKTNLNGTIVADGFTYQTDQKDVFAGGDAYTGPKFAIDAIAAGKQGAISLHRYVQPGQSLTLGRSPRHFTALDKQNLAIESYDHSPRQTNGFNHQNKNTFLDERKTFTEEQVKKETRRCLDCGVTQVDPYLCIGCGQCVVNCKFDAISLEKQFNEKGRPFEQLPIAVAKYALKRTGKIIAKGIKG